jgi:hypothetical protein
MPRWFNEYAGDAASRRGERGVSMNFIRSLSFLRQVLLLDAVSSGLMGVGLIVLATPLAGLMQLPANLLENAGYLLIPFAAFVGWLATRPQPAPWAVWTVIGVNVLWVADSVLVLIGDWVAPNAIGYGFIIAQGIVVGLFAELQLLGLRRRPLAGAAA